jgi:hypothetical protein
MANRAGITPDAWQSDLLRSQARQMILLCSRQAGKSTVSSILAIHEAVYNPDSLILLLSPSLRQSQELIPQTAGRLQRSRIAAAAAGNRRISLETSARQRFENHRSSGQRSHHSRLFGRGAADY